jgi:hypothetical protein
MNLMIKTALVASLFTLHFSTSAEEISVGLGAGTSYSGLGANVAYVSETDMKYASAGCVSYSSNSGSTCGAGIGWIKTDLFNSDSNKHGLGAYLGIVGVEKAFYREDEAVYGVGLGYHYFFNGINDSGFNLGVTVVAGDTADDDKFGLVLQAGYQF